MNDSAARILSRARRAAGMTQRELAARAGVTQSVVSAYEHGRRDPSLTTLRRLVEATGARLDVQSMDAPPGTLLAHVRARRDVLVPELAALGARDIRVFGSVAHGGETPTSDVDLLVTLDPHVGLFALGRMRSIAEAILGRPVDVVPDEGLKEPVRDSVVRDAVPL